MIRKTPQEAAEWCMEQGIVPLPVRPRSKAPAVGRGWPDYRPDPARLSEEFTAKHNVGVILGEPSGNLVDIDIDEPRGALAAPHLLPSTDLVHGRAGKRSSHWWYRPVGSLRTEKLQFQSRTIVEIRSDGAQTVIPPSVHPGGEELRWERRGSPGTPSAHELRTSVRRLAAATLLGLHWHEGIRHDASLALAGFLHRHGWKPAEATTFFRAVLAVAGDEEFTDRIRALIDTVTKDRAGQPTTGYPTLASLVGEDVAKKVAEWLELPTASEAPIERPPRFRLLAAPDILAVQNLEWHVEGLLPAGGFGVLSSDPGVGKSFLALDWACRTLFGWPFSDRKIRRGEALYIAAEGGKGLGARFATWCRHHGVEDPTSLPISALDVPVNLMDAAEADEFLAVVRARHADGLALVVIDTLARAMSGGDENSARDMGLLVDQVDRIRSETGAATLLIHHTGKHGQDERGSTALPGAADTLLRLRRSKGHIRLETAKQRDAEPHPPILLKLLPVGDSCVVHPVGPADESPILNAGETKLLRALDQRGTRGASSSEIRTEMNTSPSTFGRWDKRLRELEFVDGSDRGRRQITVKGIRYLHPNAGKTQVIRPYRLERDRPS